MKFESIPFNTIPKTRRMFAQTPDGWIDITSEAARIRISIRSGRGVFLMDLDPAEASAIGAELIAAAESLAVKEAA